MTVRRPSLPKIGPKPGSRLGIAKARALAPLLLLPLAGCDWIVMNPAGDVAVQQRDLILISTGLMLLIIIPVMILIVLFAWKYRKSAEAPDYDPDWDHSTSLELMIWSAPLLIIICLGAVTWTSTHLLDPYRPIERIHATQAVDEKVKTLEVQVVALDWKWLFIYPDLGIATVNELAAPVGVPIRFKLTSSSVMNSFYVPALAGQIYAMPGMQTMLHAVANRPGNYEGFSANYSGHGFSGMRFRFHALDAGGFDRWVKDVKAGGGALDRTEYMALEKPSEKVPPRRFATVDGELFNAIVNLCARPGQRCMNELMMVDAAGGAGKESAHDLQGLRHDGAALAPFALKIPAGTAPAKPAAHATPTGHAGHAAQAAPAGHAGHTGHGMDARTADKPMPAKPMAAKPAMAPAKPHAAHDPHAGMTHHAMPAPTQTGSPEPARIR
ncbi:ubiquinol oxidase subunit II [Sphingomonas sp. KC8]|uniref:ubiquinol oxidase subunit II n=1 Tax=Sphingomonas sp. KC8 TaxID=1030157 RepID=UPI000A07684E|nr:ubiquinol oxidase subunit II [Sphingomonas sp. KC8]